MEEMTEEEQADLIQKLKQKKTWIELLRLFDKSKGEKYWSPFADRIRLNVNTDEFQKIISETLSGHNFLDKNIKLICPHFVSDSEAIGDSHETKINENFSEEMHIHAQSTISSIPFDTHKTMNVDDGEFIKGVEEDDKCLSTTEFLSVLDYTETTQIQNCSGEKDTLDQVVDKVAEKHSIILCTDEDVNVDCISEPVECYSARESSKGSQYAESFKLDKIESDSDWECSSFVEDSEDDTKKNNNSSTLHDSKMPEDSVTEPSGLTAEEICAVLGVDKSILSYVPPSCIEVNIPPDDAALMFEMTLLKTNDGKDYWKVEFRKRKWASVFSNHLSLSEFPCSFSARHVPFISPSYKEDDKSGKNFAYGYGHCTGACKLQFHLTFPEKPKPGVEVRCLVKSTGAFTLYQKDGSTARRLSADNRSKIKEILKISKSNKVFLENISHLNALRLLHKNKFVMSESVLRTAAWEDRTSDRTDKVESVDLHNLLTGQLKEINKESNLPGYLRQLTLDPFHYEMYSWRQVKLANTLAQSQEIWLTLDASGRMVRLPKEEKYQDKQIYNYVLDVTSDRVDPFTLAEMVTTNNKATNIKAFMCRVMDDVKRAGPRKPKLIAGIVTDMSLALIHGCLEALNVESFLDYVKRSYAVMTDQCPPRDDKCLVFTCTNHVINAFRKNINLRSLNKVTNQVALSGLARMQECFDLFDLKYVSERIICLLGSEKIEAKLAEKYVQDLETKNWEQGPGKEDEDVQDFESEANQDGTEFELLSKSPFSTLKTGNQFYEDFFTLRRKICPNLPQKLPKKNSKVFENFVNSSDTGGSSKKDDGILKNPYFSPAILELLENTYVPMIPFFSAMIPRKSGFPHFVRMSNAIAESTFKINKQEWHRNRNMHNGTFVRDHFPMTEGKVLDRATEVKTIRRVFGVSLVSLNAVLDPKSKKSEKTDSKSEGTHEVEEKWSSHKTSKRPSSTRHLSDAMTLNKKQRPVKPKDEPENVSNSTSTSTQKVNPESEVVNPHSPPGKFLFSQMDNWVNMEVIRLGSNSIGCVNPNDLKSLFTGDLWLCSSLMNFYGVLLCDEYSKMEISKQRFKNVTLLPSYAVAPSKEGNIVVIESAFHRLDDSVDTIFVTLNIQNLHWILVQIENVQQRTRHITIYDSKKECTEDGNRDKQLHQIMINLDQRYGKSKWVTYIEPTVQQTDSYSCGPSVLFIMDKLLLQTTSTYTAEDLQLYRMEILRKTLKTTHTGSEILEKFSEESKLIDFVLNDFQEMARIQAKYPKIPVPKFRRNVYFED